MIELYKISSKTAQSLYIKNNKEEYAIILWTTGKPDIFYHHEKPKKVNIFDFIKNRNHYKEPEVMKAHLPYIKQFINQGPQNG